MEIIYPDDFIKFYNDNEEIDDVGEFEIIDNLNEIDLILSNFQNYRQTDKLSNAISKSTSSVICNLSNIAHNISDTFISSPPIDFISSLVPSSDAIKTYKNKPVNPPPSYLPSKNDKNVKKFNKTCEQKTFAICLNKFTYIWQNNGRSYWAYLLNANNKSISGFRWSGFRWIYFGLDLNRIDSFACH